ncbi:RNA polymerase sigma factor SigX [Lentibacillus halophilus]|uniref:RNA polymerase sigma factor SigX n=1 Tax=Lentibacillus halophilus TaxID=295065 RepID=A0ABN0ZEJ2_9BACI
MDSIFEHFYTNYHNDLYQFIFYMVKDRHICEDLVQDVYIKVMESHHSFRGDSSEKTWLFSIARHITVDYFRKQKRKRKRILDFFDWSEKGHIVRDQHLLPDEIATQNDMIRTVYYYLDKCTPDQKSVLLLRYMQSFSIQETADILNFSTSKVKTTQHRGLKQLQKYMNQHHEEEGGNAP